MWGQECVTILGMDSNEVEQSAQWCHGPVPLRISLQSDAHMADTATYLALVFILVCVIQLPRKLSSKFIAEEIL